jgi:hypothetical protein
MDETLSFYITLITNFATFPALIIMLFQLGKKYRDSLDKETGKRDPVRLLVLLQIVFWFGSVVYPTIYRLVLLANPGSMFLSLNFSTLFLSFMVAAGVSLLAFVHHKESWIYAAWFFYGGIIIYSLFTGIQVTLFNWSFSIAIGESGNVNSSTFYALQFGFMLAGQMALDLFYFLTGAKYKDDKIFGLGIFFLLPIISGASSSNVYVYMVCYGILAVYGIPYVMGKIKFFKQKPVQLVEAEVREK